MSFINFCPPGTIFAFGGSTEPDGWLLCDNSAVSRTTYSELFAAIGSGSVWGVGDGSTTFNLPDLRGVFLRGSGSQTISAKVFTGTLGTKAVDKTSKGSIGVTSGISGSTGGASPDHTHGYYRPSTATAVNLAAGVQTYSIQQSYVASGGASVDHAHSVGSLSVSSSLSGGDTETVPGSAGVNYIIKY